MSEVVTYTIVRQRDGKVHFWWRRGFGWSPRLPWNTYDTVAAAKGVITRSGGISANKQHFSGIGADGKKFCLGRRTPARPGDRCRRQVVVLERYRAIDCGTVV